MFAMQVDRWLQKLLPGSMLIKNTADGSQVSKACIAWFTAGLLMCDVWTHA